MSKINNSFDFDSGKSCLATAGSRRFFFTQLFSLAFTMPAGRIDNSVWSYGK